jgi:hypothetical protein
MKIETTLNINRNILTRLDYVSKVVNKSRTYIIRLLLGKMLDDERNLNQYWSRIKYQKRDLPDNWSTFHLILREDEYEFCLDLRKVYKMSLSHVIAFAVNKYLDKIMSLFSTGDDSRNTDNYLYRNYTISHKLIDGINCWRYYWGFTPYGILTAQESIE